MSHKKYIVNNIITNTWVINSWSHRNFSAPFGQRHHMSLWYHTDPLILSSLLVMYWIYLLICPVYEVHSEYMVQKLKAIRTETMRRRTFCTHKHVSSCCSRRELVAMIRESWRKDGKGIRSTPSIISFCETFFLNQMNFWEKQHPCKVYD